MLARGTLIELTAGNLHISVVANFWFHSSKIDDVTIELHEGTSNNHNV